ncbi:hypothetical protein [Mesorhizobium sp. M8A.F.Ca.ET.208.01.1.1]|uniref:hypothetical protein n=1 Tax=Mesorhizobium sp. M8A.F.Ca.ET.208.01.1.1 TaxID=2563969 RepID=UPI001AEE95B8|nr:hypothetical protein [Mesorhizobium sp. M8A.F.Ca.ET.208.01.1.1]
MFLRNSGRKTAKALFLELLAFFVFTQFRTENRKSTFPGIAEKHPVVTSSKGTHALRPGSLRASFFGKFFFLVEINFAQSRSREGDFRGNIDRPVSELWRRPSF